MKGWLPLWQQWTSPYYIVVSWWTVHPVLNLGVIADLKSTQAVDYAQASTQAPADGVDTFMNISSRFIIQKGTLVFASASMKRKKQRFNIINMKNMCGL
jgi:hypothetical protein